RRPAAATTTTAGTTTAAATTTGTATAIRGGVYVGSDVEQHRLARRISEDVRVRRMCGRWPQRGNADVRRLHRIHAVGGVPPLRGPRQSPGGAWINRHRL